MTREAPPRCECWCQTCKGKSNFGQFATIRNNSCSQSQLTWLSDQKQLSQGTESKGDTSPSLCLGYSHNLSVNLPNPDPPKLSVSLSCELGSRNSQDAKSKPSHLRFCDCWRLHSFSSLFITMIWIIMKQMINMTREIINIADVTCYHQHRDRRNVLSCILAAQFSIWQGSQWFSKTQLLLLCVLCV